MVSSKFLHLNGVTIVMAKMAVMIVIRELQDGVDRNHLTESFRTRIQANFQLRSLSEHNRVGHFIERTHPCGRDSLSGMQAVQLKGLQQTEILC